MDDIIVLSVNIVTWNKLTVDFKSYKNQNRYLSVKMLWQFV